MMLVAGLVAGHRRRDRDPGPARDRPAIPTSASIFQRDALLEWRTVLDNVLLQIDIRRLAAARYEPVARELLARVGLGGFEKYIRGSCRAACASGSRSAARWSTIRRCC